MQERELLHSQLKLLTSKLEVRVYVGVSFLMQASYILHLLYDCTCTCTYLWSDFGFASDFEFIIIKLSFASFLTLSSFDCFCIPNPLIVSNRAWRRQLNGF